MPDEDRGRCRDCGADLVDWATLHKRDLDQVSSLFAELPKELIRHHFWHMPVPPELRAKAERYRREVIATRVRKAIHTRVAPSWNERWDGQQTPMEHGDNAQIYFLGMHATACCCRKCMEYWHGIQREDPLTNEQEAYFAALVWLYVCQRLGWEESIGLLVP